MTLKVNKGVIFFILQDSEGTNTSTESYSTSYESPNTQLVGARRKSEWQFHAYFQ